MKEAYLHYIWKTKSYDAKHLKTTDGADLEILDYGRYNHSESGPDFLFARIILDGVQLYGHIEIHVQSNDWFLHQHHFDREYDNVILHVVFNHKPNDNLILPTLELRNRLNYTTYEQWIKMSEARQSYPCSFAQSTIPEFIQESVLFNAFIIRLERKMKEVLKEFPSLDSKNRLMLLAAKVLGNITNGEMFKQWTQKHWLDESNPNLKVNNVKTKGVRPASRPQKRLIQLRWLFENWELMRIDIDYIADYRKFRKIWLAKMNKNAPIPFTNFVADQLFINAILPSIYIEAYLNEDDVLQQKVIQLFSQIPAERNNIVDKWQKEMYPIASALQSQGVLEWTKFYCLKKQCLNCAIGHKSLSAKLD